MVFKIRLIEGICVFHKDWVVILNRKKYFIGKLSLIVVTFIKSATALRNRNPYLYLNHNAILPFPNLHIYPQK